MLYDKNGKVTTLPPEVQVYLHQKMSHAAVVSWLGFLTVRTLTNEELSGLQAAIKQHTDLIVQDEAKAFQAKGLPSPPELQALKKDVDTYFQNLMVGIMRIREEKGDHPTLQAIRDIVEIAEEARRKG